MAKAERRMKGAVTSQIDQFQQVGRNIVPVIPLNDAETIYFNQIVTDREAASWSPNHLTIACNLARTYAAVDRLWQSINEQGYTLVNERGTQIANPAVTALMSMTNTMQALNRTLGLSASQRGLSGEKQFGRNKNDRAVRELNDATDAQDLLA